MSKEIINVDTIVNDIQIKLHNYLNNSIECATHCIMPIHLFEILRTDASLRYYIPGYKTKDLKSRVLGLELIISYDTDILVGKLV